MKKTLLAGLALAMLTGGALAADLPLRSEPVAPAAPSLTPVPVFTWTGFYVGVQAGYAWGEDETTVLLGGVPVDATPVLGGGGLDADGFVGGAHAGYNHQIGAFVVGLEADIEAAAIDNSVTRAIPGFGGLSATVGTEIDFQGSLRARVGYAFDRTLVYVTGGLAFANIQNTYSVSDGIDTFSEEFDDVRWGWTIGAGVEHAFTDKITGRIEYRYTRFDDYRNASNLLLVGGAAQQEPEFHTVRAGLSFKFATY